jgi:D-glutamate N-acetyltransferase
MNGYRVQAALGRMGRRTCALDLPAYEHSDPIQTAVAMAILKISKPYLLLIGDAENPSDAKTAFGLKDWAPEFCVGQLRFNSRAVDLGLPDMSPREAAAAGAKTLVIGIAPVGGRLPDSWSQSIVEALNAGLDVAAGLHQRLAAISGIVEVATRLGRRIHDVRHSDTKFSVGTGERRPGRRLLTVGTDCALGKKYTALAITKALRSKGIPADFRATGQTGILISGHGVAVDAVVADFIAGAAESLSPANAADHWDIIEGQGSLFHPAYAGVTLGLLHGSQPDALVLCHDPARRTDARICRWSRSIKRCRPI